MIVIRYRPQRGGFDEAMGEVEEFHTIDELLGKYGPATMTNYCWDERINADTFVVYDKQGRPFGYCWFVEVEQ